MPDWERLRAHFPVFERWAYFGWASVAALSSPSAAAMAEQAAHARDGGVSVYRDWYACYDALRRQFGSLLNAQPDEIALIKNTSEGISTVASGLDWRPGDNVVLPRGEFPSNVYPWRALATRGVELRRVETEACGAFSPEAVAAAMDERTRVVSVSHVGYARGFRADLAAIGERCRARGALFFVDAIQGLGVFPVDVEAMQIDALAADGHKWLCGPEGLGVLYVRASRQDQIRPLSRGWWQVQSPGRYGQDDQALSETARRYECGTLTTVAAYGLRAALDLVAEAGVEALSERVLLLSDELHARLTSLGCEVSRAPQNSGRSGIVSFIVPGTEARALAAAWEGAGVLVNAREGRLRAAVHGWNNRADIDRLAGLVEQAVEGRA